jgi:ABC-type Fe3+/spermidine/putrescine transport system ATPase subunit
MNPREQLVVTSLEKSFGAQRVVDDLSFEIHKGEFFTLLGPSGCGKSTTLMMLAGLEDPDGGAIRLRGADVTRMPPEKRRIGVVFQSYALFPHMSILDNVAFGLRMRGTGRRAARVAAREALDLVELTDLDRAPGKLSGGQMQRVALARAIVCDPDLLLMDEPLSALDRRLRQTMQYELRKLQTKLNTTVLYVTHDQEEALALSDRIAVMNRGRFEQVGTPSEVYSRPVSAFVARFLGESNHVEATLVSDSPSPRVEVEGIPGQSFAVRGTPALPDSGILIVRPEDVRVAAKGSAPRPSENACPATVEDVTFLGDRVRVSATLPGGITWITHLPHGSRTPAQGSEVSLRWSADDAHYLTASKTAVPA